MLHLRTYCCDNRLDKLIELTNIELVLGLALRGAGQRPSAPKILGATSTLGVIIIVSLSSLISQLT
jgi:hypothetical protein